MKTKQITRNDLLKYISKARIDAKKIKAKNHDFALGVDDVLFKLQQKFDLFEFE